MTNEPYKQMLEELLSKLDEKLEERARLDKEIARLRQAVIGMERLAAGESPKQKKEDPKELLRLGSKVGLKDMIIEVLRGADKPLNATEVVKGLQELRFDFGESSKIGLVVVTLARLAKSGEAKASTVNGKKAYEWQG